MSSNQKTAIILGASGLVGGFVLDALLQDERYKKVHVYARSPLKISHEKLEIFLCDLQDEDSLEKVLDGDEAYCCIGTTKKKSPNKYEYKNIDYKIPLNLALACKTKNVEKLLVISALGANSESLFFYNRTKGQMEEAIKKICIKNTYFFQPSLIKAKREEFRFLEWASSFIFNLLPNSHKAIQAQAIAHSMIKVANSDQKSATITNQYMLQLYNDVLQKEV